MGSISTRMKHTNPKLDHHNRQKSSVDLPINLLCLFPVFVWEEGYVCNNTYGKQSKMTVKISLEK